MGLDITAYRRVKRIGDATSWDDYENRFDWRVATFVPSDQDFQERTPPIAGGVYARNEGDLFEFRAGSYSGYNDWREELSKMAMGVVPQVVWVNPERYQGLPFFELIHFSDCEGIIGTDACKRLAEDFATWQEKADAINDDWFQSKYALWRKAFEWASDGGFVRFH